MSAPSNTARVVLDHVNNVVYTFYPSRVFWNGSLVQVEAKNHQLTTNDPVNLTPNFTSAALTIAGAVTVLDADNFTIQGSTVITERFPGDYVGYPYDLSRRIAITCNRYSEMIYAPKVVQINTLTSTNAIIVQAKIHEDAPWVNVQTVLNASGNTLVVFNNIYNFVRLYWSVQTTADVKAFAQ